jgi:acetyl-CoA carboxylase biotin carboxyl carrier protein
MNGDLEQLKELYGIMLEKNLDVLEMKDEESHIKLTRRIAGAPAGVMYHPAPVSQPGRRPAEPSVAAGAEPEVSEVPSIVTPLAGLFYRASSPTSVPFVREGDVVDVGQTLCIVEAMKVMNEIKAESACRIVKILAENGRPVTAGQVLFHIEPA